MSDVPTPAAATDEAESLRMPIIDCNEDADIFWIKGHDVSEVEARVAMAVHPEMTDWASREEAFEQATTAAFDRVWYRFVDPENDDESMAECTADEVGAEPFTRLAAVSS